MSDLVNLLITATVMVGLVISYADLVVRRWGASGWSVLVALFGTVAVLAFHFPGVVLR